MSILFSNSRARILFDFQIVGKHNLSRSLLKKLLNEAKLKKNDRTIFISCEKRLDRLKTISKDDSDDCFTNRN